MTSPFLDSSVSVDDIQRARVQRSEHDVHIAQEQTLLEISAELHHIRYALEALNALFGSMTATSRSSVELAQGAKEVRLTVKLYDGSPLGTLGDDAVEEFGRLFREIERRQMDAWQETVDRGCEKVVDSPRSYHWSHSEKCLQDTRDHV